MIVAAMGGTKVFLLQMEPDILGELYILEIVNRSDFRLAVLDLVDDYPDEEMAGLLARVLFTI